MDKTDRLRDYGLAFLLYEQGFGLCGYELIRELFIFVKLILNSYLLFHKIKTFYVLYLIIYSDCRHYAIGYFTTISSMNSHPPSIVVLPCTRT